VGPFITLPLVIAAAGYKLSVWAWLMGAAIAVMDGLVWAELGAAFPRAGDHSARDRLALPGKVGQTAS
jgi:amino acid transporter